MSSSKVCSLSLINIYRWAKENRQLLISRASPLEFCLHRFEYLRILLSEQPDSTSRAYTYARTHLGHFYDAQRVEVQRLMACLLYMPLDRLKKSPYKDLAD